MDYSTFYDAIYDRQGSEATITLTDTAGTEIAVTVLYMPSGAIVGSQPVGVGTVKMSAAVRRTELTENGVTDLLVLDGATLAVNGETWKIKSWVPAPAPTGEADGELRLILAAAS